VAAERVSVVIPCFNAAAHVGGAIDSALAQRQPGVINVEVIAVDDASTDGTLALLDALAERNPGVVHAVRLAKNGGPAAARNEGLRRARGRLICFLDSDDRYAPLTFFRCARVLAARPEAAAVIFGIDLVGCSRPIHPVQREALLYSLPSNMVVRRDVAELIGGFPEDAAFRGPAAGEDIAFKRAVMDAFVVVVIADEGLRHFARPGGHLDYFLDRTEVRDGELAIKTRSREEATGALTAATERYRAAVARRIEAVEPGRPAGKAKIRPPAR
jgi:glycosyltransferase involved in cell wall biosynthesis